MKKISLLSILIVVIMATMVTSVYAATTGKINMATQKSEYNKEEEVVVDVKISNLKSDKGIITLGAVLEYDKTSLEFVKMSGADNWSNPSLNEANGKFITDRSGLTTTDESVLKITFKVKSTATATANIKLKEVEVSGGDGVFKLGDFASTIKIKNGTNAENPGTNSNTTTDNNKNNTTTNNSTSKNTVTNTTTNTTTSSTKNTTTTTTTNQVNKQNVTPSKLPKAGIGSQIIVGILVIAVIIATMFLIKYKKIK